MAGRPSRAREVLVNYLGFPFFDVLTFPLMRWRDAGEFDEILVDRISAQDAARPARPRLRAPQVQGRRLRTFRRAFLSRAYRENDYLLGRLHRALIDRLTSCAIRPAADAVRDLDLVEFEVARFHAHPRCGAAAFAEQQGDDFGAAEWL